MWLLWPLLATGLSSYVLGRPSSRLVRLPQGTILGKDVIFTRTQRAIAFLGIPFAQPPLDENRLRPPQKGTLPSWLGVKNATEYQPSCVQDPDKNLGDRLQLTDKLFGGSHLLRFSEDCLYLNVFVPEGRGPKEGGWPVLIWFHPGDFKVGSPILWDGSAIALKQKVIVVTAAYRLNIFGFLTTMDKEAPGNLGLLDQLAAIDWVSEHIHLFNGSSSDITLWGHTAGAVSVSLHLLSKLSSGKFTQAIIMSGNFLSPNVIKEPHKVEEIAQAFKCKMHTLLKCLQSKTVDELLKFAQDKEWGPVIDGNYLNISEAFIQNDPESLMVQNGFVNNVPLLTGYTDMEEIPDINDLTKETFDEFIKTFIKSEITFENDNETCVLSDFLPESITFYYKPAVPVDKEEHKRKYLELINDRKYGSVTVKIGSFMSRQGATYLYRFDYKVKTAGLREKEEWEGVGQQEELPLIWGMPYWSSLSIIWNSLDKRSSDQVMTLFGNFTRHSTPGDPRQLVQWSPFTQEDPRLLIIDKDIAMNEISNFDYKSLSFWNDHYPKIIDAINLCCNMTASTSYISPFPSIITFSLLLNFF